MSFLSKTALGILAAVGLMGFSTPDAQARDRHHHRSYSNHHHHHGYSRSYVRHYPRYYSYRRPVVYYNDSYYNRYPSYGYYSRPYYRSGISIAFGGRSFGGYRHYDRCR